MISSSKTTADDAWQALKNLESEASAEYRKRSQQRNYVNVTGGKGKQKILGGESVEDIMRGLKVESKKKDKKIENGTKDKITKSKKSEYMDSAASKESKKKIKKEKFKNECEEGVLLDDENDSDDDEGDNFKVEETQQSSKFLTEITVQEMLQKIARDLNILSDSPNAGERRNAISRVHDIITCEGKLGAGFKRLGPADYSEVFHSISKPIFKRYADPVERCRERAFRITNFLFANGADFVPVLGYFFPALMARVPPRLGYDEEMKVFVSDFSKHEEYRRGRAVDRQDALGVEGGAGALTHMVVEDSEEVRLLAAKSVLSLIDRLSELDSLAVLQSYFSDTVLFLQCQLRDLFPELKQVAAKALETLALLREFESGMGYFAVALVRMLLPLLRHRHAKVRAAGVDAVRACVIVPYRAKRKGAGTEAIVDLVGFKEDNVLNVASFYKPVISVNYLAELTSDSVVYVRERLVVMLSSFLVDLEDRYDHQQRLLPYLLDMLTDESPSVSSVALATLVRCGELYEEQHPDDIIERRQFGIDGDDRINLEKSLPLPFTERPRIGIRLYTRGNTKRFIFALVGELTNWQSKTRLKSANLLKMVTVLCEEYLTMEMYKLLPAYMKALQYARDDNDKELEAVLCEVFELAGRYTAPDSYVHYILPRIRGDVEVTQFGMEASVRCSVIDVLKHFIDGSKSSLIPPYLAEIIDVIVDPYIIDPTSDAVQSSAMSLMVKVLSKVQGKGLAMTAAHFQSTGRLKNMSETFYKAFRFIFHSLSNPLLNTLGLEALSLLSNLDSESHIIAQGVRGLLLKQLPQVLHSLVEDAGSRSNDDVDGDARLDLNDIYEMDSMETRLLELSLVCPVSVLHQSKVDHSALLHQVIAYLVQVSSTLVRSTLLSSGMKISSITSDGDSNMLLKKYADFMMYVLFPFESDPDESVLSAVEAVRSKYFNKLFGDVEVATTFEVSSKSLLELEALLPALVSTFVTPLAWGADVALQNKRMNILSSLIKIIQQKEDCKRLLSPLLLTLLEQVFRSTASPSTPVQIRVKSANLFKLVLSIFYDDSQRLVSFSKKTLDSQKAQNLTPEEERINRSMDAAKEIVMTLMLDDSDDVIRVIALESLMYVIHFVRPHGSSKVLTSDSLPAFAPPVTSYEGMVDALLLRTINGNPTEEFLVQLDYILRSLAILDISKFENFVRSKLTLLVGNHKPPSQASELFSGLLDHTEMLVTLNSL